MQSRRSIEVLLWNAGKLLGIVFGIEDSIDKVFVAKTQMLAISQQLRVAGVNMVEQLGKAGRAIRVEIFVIVLFLAWVLTARMWSSK